jgi:hypothetical protein
MPADITYIRDEVQCMLPLWRQVKDAAAGEHAVREAGELYLPRPNAEDRSPENLARYHAYLQRAVYYNAAGRTLSGLTGIAFRRWPEIVLPAGLDYLKGDADGAGATLIQ